MNFKDYPFSKLPFSFLFETYGFDFDQLASFYETNPFQLTEVKKRADIFKFSGNREKTAELLLRFNKQFEVDEAAIANINRLKSKKALTLVTGQQLGLFGGPVYTIYKILTAIHQSRMLERKLDRPIIPIFWMADEDHDYEEVSSVNVFNEEGIETFSLPKNRTNLPVSEIEYPEQLKDLKKELKKALVDTDFTGELWDLLDSCFKPGQFYLKGFGTFISRLFSNHGLVMAGSNDDEIKKQTKACLIEYVKNAESASRALKEQSKKLEITFHQQVTLYNSHLFYVNKNSGRSKISRNKHAWKTDNDRRWTTQELTDEIDRQPHRFSPDVFLRPILQDTLLPTLGYVGGPGEVAYYGQMKSFYKIFGMKMPVIFPRLSATLVEPAIVRIFRELPFEISDYQKRIEDLESDFVKRTEQIDIEALFKKWKEGIEDLQTYQTKAISNIDKTLEGASKKAQANYFNDLNKLKGKIYRAVKKNEETQIKRIHRIQRHLFPNGNLQERTLCSIYYMNKFGVDIWERLLQNIEREESFSHHKLIYL